MKLRSRRRRDAKSTYKLCSLALCYPDEELLAARAELAAATGDLPASPTLGGL
jgi:nitrate reductase assembly molybdenum cofactor insertion protein NarJ